MKAPARKIAVVVATSWTIWTIALLAPSGVAHAQLGVGTWVRQNFEGSAGEMTMTVEACCNGGRRLIYRIQGHELVTVIESGFDGKDAPVTIAGQPTGETMAITRVDAHHTSTLIKSNGTPYMTSKSTLSADGNTLTVENQHVPAADGTPGAKTTETWVKR